MGAIHRRSFRRFLRPGLTRRGFLRGLGSMVMLPLLPACERVVYVEVPVPSSPGPGVLPPSAARFDHGVASGDPLTDRVVLWTRLSTEAAAPVQVDWLISRSTDLATPVRSGSSVTSRERDHTVKIDPDGLQSYTTYYFQFSVTLADGTRVASPIGRTKTAPKAGDTDRLRFIGVSCQNYIYGFFNPYRAIAIKPDFDAILFLGDYIYEQGGTAFVPGRDHLPDGEIITLADYRTRFAQYRTDEDLQAAHRQFPFICIWDDHETANNSWVGGSDRHDPATDGDWEVRKAAAIRAYFEWMPVRDGNSTAYDSPDGQGYLATGNGSIVRSLRYGELADIILLDTRLVGRAEPTDTVTVTPEHTLLGEGQRDWLLQQLRSSTAQWKFVAQQVQFAPFKLVPLTEDQGGTYFLQDSWDGYRFDRNLVMRTLRDEAIHNVVFLSGDSHSVTAWDLPIEPHDAASYDRLTGEGSLAVEFSTGAVANLGTLNDGVQAINPHLKYANNSNGYLVLDVTAERVQGEYWFTVSPQVHQRAETFQRGFVNADGSNRLRPTLTNTAGRADAASLAP